MDMDLRRNVTRLIAPMLNKSGYLLNSAGGGSYSFANGEKTRIVTFDHEKYGARVLRVHFQVFSCTHKPLISFYLKYLNSEFFPPIAFDGDKNAPYNYIRALVPQIISIVIPYMDLIETNYVTVEQKSYEELAKNPIIRADRFRTRWELPQFDVGSSPDLDRILWSMQSSIQSRKKDYYTHLQEIIDLSAFLGELMNYKNGTPKQWYWRDLPGCRFYAVKAQGFDVLSRVSLAWVAGKEIENYSLKGFF